MKPKYHPEYPIYLTEATNEMFRTFGRDFFYSSYSEDWHLFSRQGIQNNKIHWAIYNGIYALMRLRRDQDFLIDYKKISHDWDIDHYLRNEQEIRAIEENVLIQAGMDGGAAKFLLKEATKSEALKRGSDTQEEPFLFEITGNMTVRRLFYIIGGAAIIGLNAASGLTEPIIQISYALGGALIGKA